MKPPSTHSERRGAVRLPLVDYSSLPCWIFLALLVYWRFYS